MEQHAVEGSRHSSQEVHLGTVICQYCGDVVATLPTNGVKVLYGDCRSAACAETRAGKTSKVGCN